jgi:AraC-like DNA-binding protein
VDEYLLAAGIDPALLEEQATPISIKLMFQFINHICEVEGIEDIGLQVGRDTSLYMMGAFGQWMLRADTIYDYLIRGCKLSNHVSSGEYYWLLKEPDHLRFCVGVPRMDEQDRVQNYLHTLLITINTIGEILGRAWYPAEIVIPSMSSHTAGKLSNLLPKSKIQREGRHASFLIPYALLDCPIAAQNNLGPELDFSLPTDYLTSVMQLIKMLVIGGKPTIRDAAYATGISPRTLQRSLTKHGTSFTNLVVDARMELAIEWLPDQQLTISEIARDLGYGDISNFSRAFRRATGASPRAYRKSLDKSQ